MTGTYWPHVLAIAAGAGLTVQIGMNTTLGRVLHSPLYATVANFAVGLLVLLACAVAFNARVAAGSVGQAPAWAWLGGVLGAAYVASVTILGSRLGALALLALVLSGQLVSALVVDQLGALGFPRTEVTLTRLLGATLLIAGTLLVVKR